MKTYALREKGQKKLGDKQELLYGLEQTTDRIAELKEELRKWLSGEGKGSEPLLGKKEDALKEYETIRKHLGINAGKSQGDVIRFVRQLLR
jgi:hypothetical protein